MTFRVYVDVETEKEAERVLEMMRDAYSSITKEIAVWSKRETFDKHSKDSVEKTVKFLNDKADDYQRFVFNAKYDELK